MIRREIALRLVPTASNVAISLDRSAMFTLIELKIRANAMAAPNTSITPTKA